MAGNRPTEPGELLGVYRRPADVPDRHRLAHHAPAYEGRDVIGEWLAEHVLSGCGTDNAREKALRHGRRWRDHAEGRGVHHALAGPGDVEAYAASLSGSDRTVARYWRRLVAFYEHLLTSPDHPHLYSPVYMAADMGGAAREAWDTAAGVR
ncbi:hypothetical protein [Salinigranum halophilum]|uniref:hypothetical protein n=1 Tax=Salinigranum halophilum TaxID=2565931 RepID=UPI00115CB252|nr:hypothetical protein [Salinigranum halophilum]